MKRTLIISLLLVSLSPLFLTSSFSQRFAVIGDYGEAGPNEKAVADLVKSWNPDFIITAGDNNYPNGHDTTIDKNIGQYYHEYIYPYVGSYATNDSNNSPNRFFPSLGNHDYGTGNAAPYFNYFILPEAYPGNERYYDFIWGNVHCFALNSYNFLGAEPDGTSSNSFQAGWLMTKLSFSPVPWRIVYFHHAALSSGVNHGSSAWMQWPYESWGATAVIGGHDHTYERLLENSFPYFVCGLGGRSRYNFTNPPLPESIVRYNANYGAMLVVANEDSIVFQFRNVNDSLVDSYVIHNTTGINTFWKHERCRIYPNPFSSSASIEIRDPYFPRNRKWQLTLFDFVGKPVATIEIKHPLSRLDRGDLQNGIYFYKLVREGEVIASGKLIICD